MPGQSRRLCAFSRQEHQRELGRVFVFSPSRPWLESIFFVENRERRQEQQDKFKEGKACSTGGFSLPATLTQQIQINGHLIPVKNLDKIFWPREGLTKGDVMEYYISIWPYLAPHLKDRPLSLVRYPEGIDGPYFYQKNFPDPPPWVETLPLASEDRIINYVMANNMETLVWAVNLGCIEVIPGFPPAGIWKPPRTSSLILTRWNRPPSGMPLKWLSR